MSRWTLGFVAVATSMALLAGCSDESTVDGQESLTTEADEALSNCSVVWEKELMITDLSVVGDNRARGVGPWSFGGVMKAMAGTNDVQAFVKTFVESWLVDQYVDGTLVKARPKMNDIVLAPWQARSAPGTYDLATAPFELLAIVYRVDLRRQHNTGAGAGEGRFVFGVRDGAGAFTPFTVITEFGLPTYGGKSALDWAMDWHSLGGLDLGSAAYNQRLEEITNQFASWTARAGMVPGTALNQLRTNEIALDLGLGHVPVWEMREFHIGPDGFFHPVRPARTPSNGSNGTSMLSAYVQQNARTIEDGTYSLPVKFRGVPFAAAAAMVPTKTFSWQVPGVAESLRHKFSLQTCSGCHAADTSTNFLHVAPGFAGGQATLSAFVTDIEMPNRAAQLKNLLGCQ